MAHNTVVLCQHHLNFDDVKEMMQQIAAILKVNVYLGFEAFFDISEHLEVIQWGNIKQYTDHDCYLLDQFIINPSFLNAILLYDSDYFYKWLLEKYGDQASSLPEVIDFWTKDPKENLDIIQSFAEEDNLFELYTNDFSIEICRAVICVYNDRLCDKFYMVQQWVIGNVYDPEDLIPAFDEYKTICQLFGSNGVYYMDDTSQYLSLSQLQEKNKTWEEVQLEMTKKIKAEDIINIRKCIYDKDYLKDISHRMTGEKWRKFPILYDDFVDYKSMV